MTWDVIALGHLKSIIVYNGLDGAFFLECSKEDLEGSSIGPLQWKKITTKMPQWQASRWRCLSPTAPHAA